MTSPSNDERSALALSDPRLGTKSRETNSDDGAGAVIEGSATNTNATKAMLPPLLGMLHPPMGVCVCATTILPIHPYQEIKKGHLVMTDPFV